jgi:ATP-dependent metalloprotease FtsH
MNKFSKSLFNFKYFSNKNIKLNNISKKENNNKKEYNNNNMNFFWTTLFFSTTIYSSYYLYKTSANTRSFEKISIHDLKKKNNLELIKVIDEEVILAKVENENKYYQVKIPNWDYADKNLQADVPVYFEKSIRWENLFTSLLSLGFIGAILFSMRRNMGNLRSIMDIDKSTKVMTHIETRFKDIIGQKNAKKSVEEFVDILKNREKYNKMGVNVPKGALLSGPPGTGKTLMAKAIAGECGLPFVNMVGSDFNAMFVGVGSSKIRNLYEIAKEAANEHGGCIIFIDEIDAIGQKRNSVNTFGGNSERENTLNQLLTEMDGFDTHKNVITFAATNRPELLDPALLRPGRFDRKILIDLPTLKDRKSLFEFYLNKLTLNKEIIDNISELSSKLTPGFSGADIANVVNESGIISVRNKKETVEEVHVKDAIDYVMMGSEKDIKLSENEKNIVAYHEAGHAFLSSYFKNVENPVKVSIIPREKGMLGFSQSEVSDEFLYTKTKMEELVMVLMGGRICEEIFCSNITNGASNDIEKASQIAESYVKKFGFSEYNKFLNYNNENPYKNEISNYLCDIGDKSVIDFLNYKYDEAKKIISSNKDKIEEIKKLLIENETIYYDDFKNLI